MHELLWDFYIQMDHQISTRSYDNQQQKRELAELRTLLSRWTTEWNWTNVKRDKYLDLAKELKKLWNMKVTIIPIVIGARGTVSQGLVQGLEDLEITRRMENI